MVAGARRPIVCGTVRVAFFVRKNLGEIPVQNFNTPRGTIHVSTPEATAFDLVGYFGQAGGLDQVATLLCELAEKLDPDKIAALAGAGPVPWAQRLGYLLELVEAADRTPPLKSFVMRHATQTAPLLPAAAMRSAIRNDAWKLAINAVVEPEI